MRMKQAAAVVGLAWGLVVGTAQAAPVKYIINLGLSDGINTADVSGYIITDGTTGRTLSGSNIEKVSLTTRGQTARSVVITDSELYADDDGFLQYGVLSGISRLEFIGPDNNPIFTIANNFGTLGFFVVAANGKLVFGPLDAPFTLGEAEFVSPVPLPSSASMLDAALLALGAVGYGVKLKSEKADATA